MYLYRDAEEGLLHAVFLLFFSLFSVSLAAYVFEDSVITWSTRISAPRTYLFPVVFKIPLLLLVKKTFLRFKSQPLIKLYNPMTNCSRLNRYLFISRSSKLHNNGYRTYSIPLSTSKQTCSPFCSQATVSYFMFDLPRCRLHLSNIWWMTELYSWSLGCCLLTAQALPHEPGRIRKYTFFPPLCQTPKLFCLVNC